MILTKLKVQLTVPGIDGNHASCAVLQETVGETTGGCTDVDTDFADDVDLPVFKCALQFEAASADVLQAFAEQANHGPSRNLGPGFLNLLLIHQYFASKNERLGTFARGGQAALDEQFV
jgi:hypothetical protein